MRSDVDRKVKDLFVKLIIGPQASCFASLSSREQKAYKYIVEYTELMISQLKSDLETVWKRHESEFLDYIKRRQSLCLDSTTFTPTTTKDTSPLKPTPFNIDALDDQLREMISCAIRKTQEQIDKQQWLKSEMMAWNARIGHFVTNLRRDLTAFISRLPDDIKDCSAGHGFHVSLKTFLMKIYETHMWSDVGVPKPCPSYGGDPWRFSCVYNNRIWRMDVNRITDICNSAADLSPDQEASKSIEDSLANLQREMYPLQKSLDKMNRINRESEQIIENLCAIVDGGTTNV